MTKHEMEQAMDEVIDHEARLFYESYNKLRNKGIPESSCEQFALLMVSSSLDYIYSVGKEADRDATNFSWIVKERGQ